jgi:hypothetical protein
MEVAMNAICRFFANAALRARRRSCRVGSFRFALLILAFVAPSPAKAISTDQAINFAVDAAVHVGSLFGVPIHGDAAHLLKEVIKCAADGGNAGDCTKKSVVNVALRHLPKEVQEVAGCMLDKADPLGCAQKAGLAQVPAEARPLVECLLGGGNVANCAAQQAAGVLDAETQKVVGQLKELKADTEEALSQQKGTVQDLILLMQGIEQGEFDKILSGGGPAIAKVAITLIIDVLVPPAAPIVGPVVAAMVDVYADLARKVVKALVDGDIGALPEIIFQFYFSEMIARPCALLPDAVGGFKDAICGGLAQVIGAAAGVFGDAIDFVIGIVAGIVGGIVDAFKWFIGLFDGKEDPEFCRSPQEFFAKNYLPCLGAATGASAEASPVAGLNAACTGWFSQCYDTEKKAQPMCNALGGALTDQANQVNAALDQGARTYTPAIGAFLYARREAFCTNGRHNSIEQARSAVNDFQTQCTNAIGQNVPLPVNACAHKKTPISRSPGPSLACSRAIANSNWENLAGDTCEKWCREKKENCPPQGPSCLERGNIVVEAYGFTYVFPQMERSLCVIKPWSPWDRIWAVINPPTFKYLWPSFDDHFVNIYRDTATITNPIWSNNIPAAFNDVMVPGLSLGSCRSMRTMLTANMQWTKTPVRTRLGQAQLQVLQSPVSDASRTNVSSMFRIHPTPAVTETLALTLTPVALVSSFDSCPATATFASRGSSGTDGSFTPRNNVTRTNKGGATANRGSSGWSTSRDPRGSSGTSSAIDRLTGDGMGGGAGSGSGYRLPDTARGPMPGSQPGSRGSSGASPASGQPGGSSGTSTVQPGGIPGTRSGGSSGASFTPGGGASGTFGPRPDSGTVRQNRPSNIEILRQQQRPPSDAYRYRVN